MNFKFKNGMRTDAQFNGCIINTINNYHKTIVQHLSAPNNLKNSATFVTERDEAITDKKT